jgi:DNA-binding protein Fis
MKNIYKLGLETVVKKLEIAALKSVMHLSNNQASEKLKINNSTYRYKLRIYGLRK